MLKSSGIQRKKIALTILLSSFSFVMLGSLTTRTVEAVEVSNYSAVSDYVTNEDGAIELVVPEQALQKQVADFISSKTGLTRSPTWVNLTQKVIETKYPVASGYAGNKPKRGEITSRGGFYRSSGGGACETEIDNSFDSDYFISYRCTCF